MQGSLAKVESILSIARHKAENVLNLFSMSPDLSATMDDLQTFMTGIFQVIDSVMLILTQSLIL